MANAYDENEIRHARPRWQFSLRTLLAAMVGVAIACALIAAGGSVGAALVALGLGVLIACLRLGLADDRRSAYVEAAVILTIGMMLCAVLLPAVSSGPAHASGRCSVRLRRIALALHAYHAEHGTFPPAFVPGPHGRPWHSWRVLILPYLSNPEGKDGKELYAQYDFGEPWDGPNNAKLAANAPSDFRCPCDDATAPGSSSYYFIVGPGRQLDEAAAMRLADVTDETEDTLLVVESDSVRANWLEPRDLTVQEALAGASPEAPGSPRISSGHFSLNEPLFGHRHLGNHAIMASGEIKWLRNDIDAASLRSLLTISGGEPVSWDEIHPVDKGSGVRLLWLLTIGLIYVGFVIWRHWGAGKPRMLTSGTATA